MKKLLISAFVLLAAVSVQAQNTRNNEIAVSYGISTAMILDPVANLLGSVIAKDFNVESTGAFNAEYFHHLTPLFSVGGMLNYAQYDVTANGELSHTRNFNILPAVKFHWYQIRNFSAYSKLAVGVGIENDTDEGASAQFAGHVSLLGLEVGGQAVRFFTEAGVGNQGFLAAGVRVRF